MNFVYYNPNKDAKTFKSGKPKYWGRDDDAVRAICKALDKEWEEVYDELCNAGKEKNDMPNAKQVVDSVLRKQGYKFNTLGKPIAGQKRPTVHEFAKDHSKGTYVLYLRNYYVAVVNGNIYNTENFEDEKVYSYWVK